MNDTELAIADSIAEHYAEMIDSLIETIDKNKQENSSLKAANRHLLARTASLECVVAVTEDVATDDILAREEENDAMFEAMQKLKKENERLRATVASVCRENESLITDGCIATVPVKKFKPCKLPKKYHKTPGVLAMKRLIAAGKITNWESGKCGDQLAARVSFPGGLHPRTRSCRLAP